MTVEESKSTLVVCVTSLCFPVNGRQFLAERGGNQRINPCNECYEKGNCKSFNIHEEKHILEVVYLMLKAKVALFLFLWDRKILSRP